MRAASLPTLVTVLAAALAGACRRPAASRPASPRPVDAGQDSFIRRPSHPAAGCPASAASSTAEGSVHADTVAGVERWRAADSPHRLPFGVHVHSGGDLTIEPCALVLVGPGMEVVVHGGAAIHAAASASGPIRVARLDRARAWQALELRAEARAGSSLAGVLLEGGGAAPAERRATAATLRLAMRAGLEAPGLTIADGDGWGVAILGEGRFADPGAALELRGLRGEGAVTVEDVNRVGDLPELRFAGNASDDVRVEARVRTLTADARWRALGGRGRYRVRPAMHVVVEGESSPTLTLEAGVRVSFGADAELDVGFGGPGALVVEGLPAQPVVLDGADSERWVGIHLGPRMDVRRSRIAFARIEHAGAPSGVVLPTCGCAGAHLDEAMLTLHGVDAPGLLHATQFVDGPPAGVAVLRAGNFPGSPGARPFAGAASDFTRSSVRCIASAPLVGGGCAPEPHSASGSR